MLVADALNNAVRLLEGAEGETNLALAETYTRLAECWVDVARLLADTGE